MYNYHNETFMQQEHTRDLLEERRLDGLAKQARGQRRNPVLQSAADAGGRLSCLMLGWGKEIMQGPDASRRDLAAFASALVRTGLVLNRLAYPNAQGCNCCL